LGLSRSRLNTSSLISFSPSYLFQNQSRILTLEKITLSEDNFVFMAILILMNKIHPIGVCEKQMRAKLSAYRKRNPTARCCSSPSDIFDIRYKITNLGINENNVWCRVYDGSNLIKTKVLDVDGNFDHYQARTPLGGDPQNNNFFRRYELLII